MIELKNILFRYQESGESILRDVSLTIQPGEMVAITGPSGSGKSTLFYVLGGLLEPTSGSVLINGHDVYAGSSESRAVFRNQNIGFIFQHFHLLPRTSVLNNIKLPAAYLTKDIKNLDHAAEQLTERLGLAQRREHHPEQLSGGQQQRVAIARALLFDPEVLLCDEPTGNLDSKNSTEVMEILRSLHERGKTIIIITHDPTVAAACGRQIEIRDGAVVSDTAPHSIPIKSPAGTATKSFHSSSLPSWRQSAIPGLENIRRNKVKSFLTMVGVSIGTAALVAVITLGEFSKRRILEGYEALGINRIDGGVYSRSGQTSQKSGFKGLSWENDLLPLRSVFPEIRYLSPVTNFWFERLTFGGLTQKLDNSQVVGVNEQYQTMSGFPLAEGRWISAIDLKEQRNTCVVGEKIAKGFVKSSVGESLVGKTIEIFRENVSVSCSVIGVLRSIKSNKEWNSPDSNIYAPVPVVQRLSWSPYIQGFAISAAEVSDVEPLTVALKNYFIQKYGKATEVWINNDSKLIAQMNRFLSLFSLLLIAVASISLMVGGVGIYNMMAVSVAERLREIGLRKALGAGDRAIRRMVLFESALLCSLAGVIGVGLGIGGCAAVMYFVSQIMPKVTFEWLIHPGSIAIGMIACIATGILSGLVPAKKAERMQIIQALRME